VNFWRPSPGPYFTSLPVGKAAEEGVVVKSVVSEQTRAAFTTRASQGKCPPVPALECATFGGTPSEYGNTMNRHALIPALLSLCFVFNACTSENTPRTTEQDASARNDSAMKEVTLPYPMAYSAKFVFTDPEKGRKVLDLWKHYDANTRETANDLLADTVALELPGLRMRAGRDSVVSVLRARRSARLELRTEMDVLMSVREPDKGDDWVLVWAVERYTDQAGHAHAVKYQQVWGLNKQGKVYLIEQFDRSLQ